MHDGDTVSVHRPGFFARRFQNFMKDKVFKRQTMPTPKPSSGTENAPHSIVQRNISSSMSGAGPSSSHRKSQYKRTLSGNTGTTCSGTMYEVTNINEQSDNEILSPPIRGGTSKVSMTFLFYHIYIYIIKFPPLLSF